MSIERIKRNLDLNTQDVVERCKTKILDKRSSIIRKGNNRSVSIDDIIITVNTYSYIINNPAAERHGMNPSARITAHKQKTL